MLSDITVWLQSQKKQKNLGKTKGNPADFKKWNQNQRSIIPADFHFHISYESTLEINEYLTNQEYYTIHILTQHQILFTFRIEYSIWIFLIVADSHWSMIILLHSLVLRTGLYLSRFKCKPGSFNVSRTVISNKKVKTGLLHFDENPTTLT